MNSADNQPGLDPSGFDPPGVDSPAVDSEEYFDPDMPDSSEQYFSASLEAAGERPRFVLDAPAEPVKETEPPGEVLKSEAGVTEKPDSVADFSELISPE